MRQCLPKLSYLLTLHTTKMRACAQVEGGSWSVLKEDYMMGAGNMKVINKNKNKCIESSLATLFLGCQALAPNGEMRYYRGEGLQSLSSARLLAVFSLSHLESPSPVTRA